MASSAPKSADCSGSVSGRADDRLWLTAPLSALVKRVLVTPLCMSAAASSDSRASVTCSSAATKARTCVCDAPSLMSALVRVLLSCPKVCDMVVVGWKWLDPPTDQPGAKPVAYYM